MARPKKLAHVVYQTRQFDQMISWYQKVFEAEVVHQDAALAFLTYDEEHHRFAFANLDTLKPESDQGAGIQGELGVNHVAYTYDNLGDLLDTFERLKAEGITPYWPIHHGPTLSLYYQDPDGNRMELQVDACSLEEAKKFMQSDVFAENPLGVVIDPDELLARYRNGEPLEILLAERAGPASAMPAEHGLS